MWEPRTGCSLSLRAVSMASQCMAHHKSGMERAPFSDRVTRLGPRKNEDGSGQ